MKRRDLAALPLALALPAAAQVRSAPDAGRKVLRVAFNTAETGFDPVQLSDLYSRTITQHIFEGAYQYDPLARPVKMRPLLATAMPEVSDDFRTWTVRVRRGIYFQDDPAFGGKPRELEARDLLYPFLRSADPALRSQIWTWIETFHIIGLKELRRLHLDQRTAFDYDAPIEGLQLLDRHAFQMRLERPNPRFIEVLAASDLLGAQAREVVEHYGERIAEHPVGTGPFRLAGWRRSSLITLQRNPTYREMYYDAEPAPDDDVGQDILARLKGRRIPMVDEVQVSIIDEDQPRWLAFLQGGLDCLASQYGAVPGTFVPQAMPHGRVAPNLAKLGIQGRQNLNADVALTFFNMEDPVVGGYTADKVALRRAFSLALDVEREIRVWRRGQAIPAQSIIVPHTSGYDPDFKSVMSSFDPARSRALLDMYGYVDRDGDGWREQPDGSPLVLTYASQPDQTYREYQTMLRKQLGDVGLRVEFEIGQWPEQLKKARAGKLQIWGVGSSADAPDGAGALNRVHGPQSGGQNLARFKLAAMDDLVERINVLPDGPEREALFVQAKKLEIAYMPYRATVHRISTDLWYPWVTGFRRPLFNNDWWHLVDLDPQMRAEALG